MERALAGLARALAIGVMLSTTALATEPLAILYPGVREPYRTVFEEVIAGIEGHYPGVTKRYELWPDYRTDAVRNWLRAREIRSVITLGTRGFDVAKVLQQQLHTIVVGAALLRPQSSNNGFDGITLAPDPSILFQYLAELAPQVRQVAVIYNQQLNGWLIELAHQAAAGQGIELDARGVDNLRQAAEQYREVLRCEREGACAVWVLQDPATVDDRAILPLILKKAWDNHLVVFSSSPSHVRKGALFSLFPDNYAMGQRLAELAARASRANRGDAMIEPLRNVRIAVNLRTAEHLGLRFSSKTRGAFDMIFPLR